MDIQSDAQKNQAISDDQELAKVLAGVNQSADDTQGGGSGDPVGQPSMPTPPTPMPTGSPISDDPQPVEVQPATPTQVDTQAFEAATPDLPQPPQIPQDSSGDTALDDIKQQALGELRPLVDKLNVDPEEKFDTYLLLLRSTDDKELIAPAHAAAVAIADEARRAQALLDIIKEIDFLSQSQK